MRDIMIDVETMGTGPNAALVQIGAVHFDAATGKTGDVFLCDVSLADSVHNYGGKITAATVQWWAEQGGFTPVHTPVTVAVALSALTEFFDRCHDKDTDSLNVWAKGPHFDIAILEHHYLVDNVSTPWKYSRVRDTRTVHALAVDCGFRYLPPAPTHRADQDCMVQIQRLVAEYAHLLWHK